MKMTTVQTFRKKILTLFVFMATISLSAFSPTALAASDATQSINAPAAATQGQTFTVKVNANTGTTDGVSVVLSKVSYDAAKVQFISVDFTGAETMTSTGSEEAAGAGYFQFSRFTTTPMSANHAFLIGTLTFKALGSSGTAAFSVVKADSHMQAGASDVLGTVSGGSTALQAPVVTPPTPTPTGTNPTPATQQPASPTTPTKTTSPSTATPTTNPTTPASTPAVPTSTSASAQPTTAQGAPIAAASVSKKKSNSTYIFVAAASVLILAGGTAFFLLRSKLSILLHRNTLPQSLHSTVQSGPVAPPSPSLSTLPPANNLAPGEVIAPVDGQPPKPPVAS